MAVGNVFCTRAGAKFFALKIVFLAVTFNMFQAGHSMVFSVTNLHKNLNGVQGCVVQFNQSSCLQSESEIIMTMSTCTRGFPDLLKVIYSNGAGPWRGSILR